MELAELLPPGVYTCWRVTTTTRPNALGSWQTESSPPYTTRGGAISGAVDAQRRVDESHGMAMASPWRQTNIASSENILIPDGEPDTGDITWENTWGETVAVKRSRLIVGD